MNQVCRMNNWRVDICCVYALTVADHELIVNKAMTVLCREKITLELNTLITTAVAGILSTDEIRMTCEFLCELRIITYSHIPWVHWVLKTESTLILTNLDLELRVFLPLYEEILHMERCVICLELNTISEIAKDSTVNIETNKTLCESVTRVLAILRSCCILTDEITTELWSRNIGCHLATILLFCLLVCLLHTRGDCIVKIVCDEAFFCTLIRHELRLTLNVFLVLADILACCVSHYRHSHKNCKCPNCYFLHNSNFNYALFAH